MTSTALTKGRSWKIRARVQSEGDNHVQEDACGFAGADAWIIDGATSLLQPLGLPAASDPSWLAQTLSAALAEAACAKALGAAGSEEGVATRELLARGLVTVDRTGQLLVGQERVRFPSAAVSVAHLDDDGVELLSLADCHVVVELADGGVEHVIGELADVRVQPASEPARGAQDPTERRRLLLADRERRNTAGGLWVARREPEAAAHAFVARFGPPALLVMASDGAWRAVDLGLVAGPEEFLRSVRDPVAALELMHRLRSHQRDIGEAADDATVLVLEPGRRAQM
ncbi:hypothetical protein IV500_03065 [Paeniglutamicibacter antarcticus]|uniref:PPM-type phosphatase domain-containing protein n=1 Tax=Arthrobacter terrae TaxID=2935737 RepID=A0A931CM42_9MICC|nr:hypothetical protein [Arthrobacter terrae]MBG0738411.1 hypothetical protein [Arthrobacter terrae]